MSWYFVKLAAQNFRKGWNYTVNERIISSFSQSVRAMPPWSITKTWLLRKEHVFKDMMADPLSLFCQDLQQKRWTKKKIFTPAQGVVYTKQQKWRWRSQLSRPCTSNRSHSCVSQDMWTWRFHVVLLQNFQFYNQTNKQIHTTNKWIEIPLS